MLTCVASTDYTTQNYYCSANQPTLRGMGLTSSRIGEGEPHRAAPTTAAPEVRPSILSARPPYSPAHPWPIYTLRPRAQGGAPGATITPLWDPPTAPAAGSVKAHAPRDRGRFDSLQQVLGAGWVVHSLPSGDQVAKMLRVCGQWAACCSALPLACHIIGSWAAGGRLGEQRCGWRLLGWWCGCHGQFAYSA